MSLYRIKVEIEQVRPDGSVEPIAHGTEAVGGAVEVRGALHRAAQEADRQWRIHSWDREQRKQ